MIVRPEADNREARGLTQEALAHAAALDTRNVGGIERGGARKARRTRSGDPPAANYRLEVERRPQPASVTRPFWREERTCP
jgi:transcriptional regulator with XRE-family HTH domain